MRLPPPVSAIRETLAEGKAQESPNEHNPVSLISSKPTKTEAASKWPNETQAFGQSLQPVETSIPTQRVPAAKPTSTVPAQDSSLFVSGDKFINSPSAEPPAIAERTRLQSPDLDMTSAYTFQQSKRENENKASLAVKRVQIQDLLAQESRILLGVQDIQPLLISTPEAQTGSKRSFSDAFAKSEDDVGEADAESPEPIVTATSISQQPSTDPTGLQEDSVSPADREPSAIPVQPNNARPIKRRRFAEVAACVALGGAGVLSALIMSAPSFA